MPVSDTLKAFFGAANFAPIVIWKPPLSLPLDIVTPKPHVAFWGEKQLRCTSFRYLHRDALLRDRRKEVEEKKCLLARGIQTHHLMIMRH